MDTDDALALKTVLDEIADQLTHTGDSKAVRLAAVHSLTGQRLGMVSIHQLQAWAGHSTVVVRPVLDLNVEASSHGRFPSTLVREQVVEANRRCVFPYCERPAEACDADHITPWSDPDNGGPPDQTRTGNLAPLCRHHHRVKTHTGWRYRQTTPGIHEWTSPHGLTFHIDRGGTTDTSAVPDSPAV